MTEYDKQAKAFLDKTHTTIEIKKAAIQKPANWQPHGLQYQVKLENAKGSYIFDFWGSYDDMQHGKNPTAYDILAAINKYEPADNIDDFAAEFGYTKPSEAIRVYEAVKEEWQQIKCLFTDEEIKELQEIN